MTTPPTLSVVIPAYNAAAWLPRTLEALRRAIALAAWPDVEIVVVDDGSTDDTATVLAADTGIPAVSVVSQPNAGRFLARWAGLRAARGELVLLLDSRVFPHEPSLGFIRERLATHPDQTVWNGDVVIDTARNPYAGFWAALVKIAWRRWFADRTEAAYGLADFDHYPKGTTFFVAPRSLLLRLVEEFVPSHDDLALVSDDTHLLRSLAAEQPIRLANGFCCTYHGREDLRGFLRQAYYRGTTFVDGHLRRGSRFLAPFLLLAAASPTLAMIAARRPTVAAVGLVAAVGTLGATARRCGASAHEAGSLAALAPVFGVVYAGGIGRGIVLRARSARRRRTAQAEVATAQNPLSTNHDTITSLGDTDRTSAGHR
ncbi:MAG: glycosyltransferase family 2 protein [Acidimicrobiales bacterium]